MDSSQSKYFGIRLFRHGQPPAWRVFVRCLICLFLCTFLPDGVRAELIPDSIWVFHQQGAHHHLEQNEIWLSADRPGFGTGSEVLNKGFIQWETGFEAAHVPGAHSLTLPATLFRFGVHKRVELRLEYGGILAINDHPDTILSTQDEHAYVPSPLYIGAKILLWDHHGGSLNQKWIPRTALLLNIGAPLTPGIAKAMPVSGSADLLFEHEVTEWLSIGYDIGAQWVEWAPTPDIFASLGINFEPTDHLGVFIESYNIFDTDAVNLTTNTRYTHYDINLDFGLTYAVHPRVQLDAYAGFSLYDSEPLLSGPKNFAFFGLGVTWLIWHP